MQNAGALALRVIRPEPTPTAGATPRSSEACPLCKGAGWLYESEDSLRPVRCRCARQREADELFAASGLAQGEYAHMRLDTYAPQDTPENTSQGRVLGNCRKLVEKWRAGKRCGASICGAVGTGKTHLGIGLLAEACRMGMTVGFYSMPVFFDNLLDSFGKKNTADLMDALTEPDIVLLDDIGAEMRSGDMVQRTYYHIADTRLVNQRITLMTSNLAFEKLENIVGARTFSRFEVLFTYQWSMFGADYRRRKR